LNDAPGHGLNGESLGAWQTNRIVDTVSTANSSAMAVGTKEAGLVLIERQRIAPVGVMSPRKRSGGLFFCLDSPST